MAGEPAGRQGASARVFKMRDAAHYYELKKKGLFN